ncbi:DNA topoisomerase I [Pyrococcus sp. NA2]|uniref:DNA topoisomerase I n=1 Tax=Pyrococcus sp. (strain NA2) TaxID=342949 RepID=UPI000209AC5D|nr:DNA topoisomerase I [Pyrococcus sp. NA2]AEC52146.1 DNA topoisomerase I [Pyrococcus sp. NA2]
MILVIAEKPNVARKIAGALAEGRPIKRTMFGVPFYELFRDGKKVIVAPAVGHLYGLAPKQDFYGYPIFEIEWVPVYMAEKGKEYAKDYINLLSVLSRRVREFIVACDYDTEGEVIGYTALKYACKVDPKIAKRMKFSTLTKGDLIRAWYNLEPTINFGMANAGIARHILDWYWGVNLSRALTHAIKRASGKWIILSTGRVQGPTLKFLVDREREIQSFVPKPYWVIKMVIEKGGKKLVATYEKDKVFDEAEAKRIVEETRKGKAIVEKVEVKRQNRNPPVPFDLGTLQREAYSAFGYSPKKTLDIAQSLYEKGYCLHPDSLILTPSGIKKIRELPEKGEVLALDFNLKLSKAKYRLLERDADEPMYRIILSDGTELYLTGDHPVLTYREGRLIFIPAEKLKENDKVVLLNGGYKDTYSLSFLLEEASMDDYIIYEKSFGEVIKTRMTNEMKEIYSYLNGKIPIPVLRFLIEKKIVSEEEIFKVFRGFSYLDSQLPINDRFWHLIGMIIAIGYKLENDNVILLPSKEITNRVIEHVEALGIPFVYDGERLVLKSKSLSRLLKIIGDKVIPPKKDWMISLIKGYQEVNGLRFRDKELAYKLKVMFQLLGVRTRLKRGTTYELVIDSEHEPEVEEGPDAPRVANGDVYILEIKSIDKFHYRGKVYDLVVEDYHNFIANGVIVHNCSYPRTSSQKLPKNLNFRFIIQNIARMPEYRPIAHELLGKEVLKPVEGKKEDPAHPAIYPTGEIPEPGELTRDEWNLYDLIVRRFLALFMEPAVRESMKVIINANGHRYILSGARTVKEGWLRAYGKYIKFDEVILPLFFRGERVRVLQVRRERKKTKPPARYSPAAVIKKMEDLGLGTKATRAQILETLYQRGYIEGKKSIKVTPLGMKVVETLEKYVPEIVSVELTREFEEKMELIMQGKLTKEEVIEEAKERLTKILQKFKEKELEIGIELAKIVVGEDVKLPLVVGKCPKCGGDLIVKYNKKTGKRFVGCSNWPKCDVTYPILQKGEIIPTNKTCCNGAPVVIIREEDGREIEICLDMNCKWPKSY